MGNIKSRLDLWKKDTFNPVIFTTEGEQWNDVDKRISNSIVNAYQKFRKKNKIDTNEKFTQEEIFRVTKELIFNIEDGKPVFHHIMYSLNVRRGEMQLSHLINHIVTGKNQEEIVNEIKMTLAMAYIHQVPVYPNTEELVSILAQHHRELLIEGFNTPGDPEKSMRLKLVTSAEKLVENIEHIQDLKISEMHSAAELAIFRDSFTEELNKRNEAGRILKNLRSAIVELKELLIQSKRNERKLQKCLTNNPILFGTEYKKIIPQHELGSDFVMDYALERISGVYDLVEIESSTLPLYSKSGNPTKELIHAEQQVLDWLEWIEHNNPYARENLPGIMQPIGYVIIGRNTELNDCEIKKLKRRNIIRRNYIIVMTYDDLLLRSENLLNILSGKVV